MGLHEGTDKRGSGFLEAAMRVISGQESPVEKTKLKFGEVRVRSMNFDDPLETQNYVGFLNDPRITIHFANPPRDVRDLKERAKENRDDHYLVATRVERIEGKLTEIIVGGARLTDNVEPGNENWISNFVVDPNKHDQGIGKKMLKGVIDWAYENKTNDDKKRNLLHLGITMGFERWEAMAKVAEACGFKLVNNMGRSVNYWDITYPDGTKETVRTNKGDLLHGEKMIFEEKLIGGKPVYVSHISDGSTVIVNPRPSRRLGFSFWETIKEDSKYGKYLRKLDSQKAGEVNEEDQEHPCEV